MLAVLYEEEETQIAGFTTIIDYTNATMKQISLFSLTDMAGFVEVIQNYAGRHKQLILTNLPSFGVFLVDLLKGLMNEKTRKRLFVTKKGEDLKNFIRPATILPKEFGGKLPQQAHLDRFMIDYKKCNQKLREMFNVSDINWDLVPDMKSIVDESIGSFRKLEID